jgi:methylmalonyl-CoA/ethylmalonyl-CoA epimerase
MLQNGLVLVELISFLDPKKKSPVDFLFKSKFVFLGNGIPYHICYEVNDIAASISYLKEQKFIVIQKPATAVALNNKYVAFLFNRDIGIIELCQK